MPSRVSARRRCSQSGVRCPGRRRGRSKAPPGRFPEPSGEEGAVRHLVDDQALDLVGIEHHCQRVRGLVGIGEADDDPVVATTPPRWRRRVPRAVGVKWPAPTGRGPGRRTGRASRVASRRSRRGSVSTTIDAVGGQSAGGRLQLGARYATRLAAASRSRWYLPVSNSCAAAGSRAPMFGDEGPQGPTRLHGPPQAHRPARTGCGRAPSPGAGSDDHPVGGDLVDLPRGGAEDEDVADPALVDHLLVELAHPAALRVAPPGRGRDRGWSRHW